MAHPIDGTYRDRLGRTVELVVSDDGKGLGGRFLGLEKNGFDKWYPIVNGHVTAMGSTYLLHFMLFSKDDRERPDNPDFADVHFAFANPGSSPDRIDRFELVISYMHCDGKCEDWKIGTLPQETYRRVEPAGAA